MTRPTAAMLVIGDEILSGRTRDANAHHLACELTRIGVELVEVRMVRDVQAAIVEAVNELRARVDHLFTSGGIGPTHDDITADAIAAAFGVGIDVHPEARAVMAARYAETGRELNAARLRMARIPDGAHADRQPRLGSAGFLYRQRPCHGRRAGHLPRHARGPARPHRGRRAAAQPLLPLHDPRGRPRRALGEVAAAFPDVSMGSYPFGGTGAILVLRHHDPARLAEAAAALRTALVPLGGAQAETPP